MTDSIEIYLSYIVARERLQDVVSQMTFDGYQRRKSIVMIEHHNLPQAYPTQKKEKLIRTLCS